MKLSWSSHAPPVGAVPGLTAGRAMVDRIRLRVPFVATSPLTDICLGLALLPLWWVLGLEQFVWILIATLAAAKLVVSRRRIAVPWSLVLLGFGTGCAVLSGLAVTEQFRYFTLARAVMSYLTWVLLVLVGANCVRTRRDVAALLGATGLAIASDTVLGAAAVSGLFRPEYSTFFGKLLPSALTATDLGSRFLAHSLGDLSWLQGIGSYFRVTGLFLYATMHSAALAITAPLLLHLALHGRPLRRWLWWAAIGLTVVNLGFASGRTAIAALLSTGAIWALTLSRSVFTRAALVVVALVGAIAFASLVDVPGFTTALLEARGSSTSNRLEIYAATATAILERPLLGHGTELDVEGLPYPAGSHSFYLGIAFKHGVPALLFFVVALVASWRNVGNGPLGDAVRWSLALVAIVGLTDVLDLDATTFFLAGVVLAIANSPAVRGQRRPEPSRT